MANRVHPAFRKLFGLAAAPGRALSTLEPESRVLPALTPELGRALGGKLGAELGGVEDGMRERLAPLLTPASVGARLERTLTKLAPVDGDGASAPSAVRRGGPGAAVSGGMNVPSAGGPAAGEPRRPVARRKHETGTSESAAAGGSGRAAMPERRVDPLRLQEMAGIQEAVPETPLSERRPVRARPEARDASMGRTGPRLPSREEARARIEQQARLAGATSALETPVLSREATSELADMLARSLVASEPTRGAQAASPGTSLERALERLDARGPSRSRLPSSASSSPGADAGDVAGAGGSRSRAAEARGGLAGLAARADEVRGGLAARADDTRGGPGAGADDARLGLAARTDGARGGLPARTDGARGGLPARTDEARGGLTGLAGLAARAAQASSGAAPVPRARTESHPPPPLLASTALPSPAIPSVLAERMEETKLSQRLERLLRREAERAGVSLEGLDP